MIDDQKEHKYNTGRFTDLKHVIDVHAHFMLPADPVHPHFGVWNEYIAMAFMDMHGIGMQMLSNSMLSTPERSRAMNEYVASLVVQYPTRFGLLANLPAAHIEASLKEIEYASEKLGADGFTLPSNINGQYWGSDAYDPILAELNHRKASILLHPSITSKPDFINLDRPANLIEVVMDTARTLVNALYTGVFQKYPDIKLVVAHAGGVLPILAPRLFGLGTLPWVPNPNMLTVAEMKAQLTALYYDTGISASTATLFSLLELTGTDHLIFGTDYPPAGNQLISDGIESLKNFCQRNDAGHQKLDLADVTQNAIQVFPSLKARLNIL